jgi:imidazolonepropionase-like amidohydrolase
VSVISTLQTFVDGGEGAAALANATALVAAGVPLRYGTDLGNVGTRPGVDARELDRLTDVGLGRMGALRAATVGAAAAPGVRGGDGTLTVGRLADAVVLDADPLHQPEQWLRPRAVLVAGRIVATSR